MIIRKILVAIVPIIVVNLLFQHSLTHTLCDINEDCREVYVKKHFFTGAIITTVCGIVCLVMLFFGIDWIKQKEEGVFLVIMVLAMMMGGFFYLLWQVNWRICYDEEGFQYRTIFRKTYYFKYEEIASISRKGEKISLHTKNVKISFDKRNFENWHPFMVLLTKRMSIAQCTSKNGALLKKRKKKTK